MWLAIGFLGQFIFGSRFIVQWLYSEYKKESIIPLSFWYLSILGSFILLVYSWILFSYAHSKVKEAEKYREELLSDLVANPPKYIISVRSLAAYQKFADIYHFINTNYSLEKTFPDDRFVYVRNTSQTTSFSNVRYSHTLGRDA